MLQSQKIYGTHSAQADDGALSLGRNLYRALPDDRHDRRPLHKAHFRLVADVRLDNRDQLAAALDLGAPQLARMSDTHVLFEALLRWGQAAVERLVGEFAFALWNGAEQSLLLGRDIFGHRPLYFHQGRDFFAWSSMPSGLHALVEIPHEFDSEIMAESLALLPYTGRKTHFRGIERVQPGHLFRVTRQGVRAHRFWDPPGPSEDRRKPEEYEEGLRDVFGSAVRAQMRGAGDKLGTQLSGGLDSAIVTATAAQQAAPSNLVSFTAVPRRGFAGPVPDGTIADERQAAAATAARYPNIEHVVVEPGEESLLTVIERQHLYMQQPTTNPCNAAWGRDINRAAQARGVNVLLVGFMGNLTISYAGMEHLSALLLRGHPLRALQLARLAARNGIPWRTLIAQLAGPVTPAPAWKLACKLYGRPTDLGGYSALAPQLKELMAERAKAVGEDILYRPTADPLAYRNSALFDGDNGNYFKGVLAEFGVSTRDPTTDKRVLEYCFRIPPGEYIRGGQPRSLARRAFADRLPASVSNGNVRGYQAADWYQSVIRDLPVLREECNALSRCGAASETISTDWLKDALDTMPAADWANTDVVLRYRYGLLRGISAGYFMRRVSGTN